jgi:hydroxyisourate hydrolase
MKAGNVFGLPVNFLVFAVITVIVTAGTLKVFGEATMDPVLIVERVGNPIVIVIGSITFIVATMGINIVANFVSPAYDIANLYPERINFRLGGLITSILSVLVCAWLFIASPHAITLFVSIFGSVLGPLFGIIIADYYLVRNQQVAVEDLYSMSPDSAYHHTGGWDRTAVVSLCVSACLSIGFALLGAYGSMINAGDWGWLIGAGTVLYSAMSGFATGRGGRCRCIDRNMTARRTIMMRPARRGMLGAGSSLLLTAALAQTQARSAGAPGLTTHVLDTASGKPAENVRIDFSVLDGETYQFIRMVQTNADGRNAEPLLTSETMKIGQYQLIFHIGAYFARTGSILSNPPFLDRAVIQFGISDVKAHYHVPLLASPWSYTTYRGS